MSLPVEFTKFAVGDIVYDEKTFRRCGLYDVTMVTNVVVNAVYGFWSTKLAVLPKTIEEFNSLKFSKLEQHCVNGNLQLLKLTGSFVIGDYVYDAQILKMTGLYDVTRVTKINKDKIYGYWAMHLHSCPETLKAFNSLSVRGDELCADSKDLKLLTLDSEIITSKTAAEQVKASGLNSIKDLKCKIKDEFKSELKNLDNYDSNILLGLANLSEEEAIDYFLNKVIPNTISIIESLN